MNKNVAVLLGNGRYAIALHRRLRGDGLASLSVSLFPRSYTAIVDQDLDDHMDIFRPEEVRERLDDRGITHVVFGGDFRQQVMGRLDHGDQPPFDERRRDVPGLISALRDELLTHGNGGRGIQPILASTLLTELKPQKGLITRSGRLASMSDDNLETYIREILPKARALLAKPGNAHARQAFIFDGDDLAHSNSYGTDALLMNASRQQRPDKLRALVKICPDGWDHQMDPPVVHPRHLENAVEAYVDLVVIDSVKGILFDLNTCVSICKQAGITVFGCLTG